MYMYCKIVRSSLPSKALSVKTTICRVLKLNVMEKKVESKELTWLPVLHHHDECQYQYTTHENDIYK